MERSTFPRLRGIHQECLIRGTTPPLNQRKREERRRVSPVVINTRLALRLRLRGSHIPHCVRLHSAQPALLRIPLR
ncbi:hypothetical protein E2C01_018539 [Portunus trituberculatus]|uniref:Uncharacterized protein n=1 Tax=Portunus trituberculatus TaxID=210409 RepID=A0A5B7DVF0_PORTR|nr:hypothetical protein [Portunus trituberculatus]